MQLTLFCWFVVIGMLSLGEFIGTFKSPNKFVSEPFLIRKCSILVSSAPFVPFKYNFMVSLQGNGGHSCGGTLYNGNTIITAAVSNVWL